MFYQVDYFDEAENDIIQIKEWYQLQSSGLEKRFMNSLEEAVNKLQIYPTSYAIKYSQIRTIRTNTFPYKICFYITKKNVVIVAVVHNKRDNKLVKQRIKK